MNMGNPIPMSLIQDLPERPHFDEMDPVPEDSALSASPLLDGAVVMAGHGEERTAMPRAG